MRKFISIITITAMCGFVNAQSWITLNSGSNSNLKAIHFPTANTGYAVGNLGTILKTSNGGTNWQSMTSAYAGYWFWDVHFVNADTGFVVGESDPGFNPSGAGIILKTINGGTTWSVCLSGTATPFRDLFVLSADTIFACGGAEQTDGKIMKSVNGGTTWTQIGLTYYDAMIGGMCFLNSNVGFLGVYESVFGTYNPTKATWLNTTNGSTFTTNICSAKGYWNFATDFPDQTTGYSTRATYVSGDTVYLRKTTNGGLSWTETSIPYFAAGVTGVGLDFIDANTGYVTGGDGAIMKTTDGGATWTMQVSGVFSELRSVFFVNNSLGFAAGENGVILKWSSPTGINETNAGAEQIVVYPNPNNGFFQIQNLKNNSMVDIYNPKGQLVLSKEKCNPTTGFDISAYSPGLYFISVKDGSNVHSFKIIKY